jgi:hypothetical protein
MPSAHAELLDSGAPPDAARLAAAAGEWRPLWDRLAGWLASTYGVTGEPFFFGKKTGWVLRFRRGGKALAMLQPCRDGLRALIVIGPTVAGTVLAAPLLPATRAAYEAAVAYPEGRWIWLEVTGEDVCADVERLVAIKSPPPRRPRPAG